MLFKNFFAFYVERSELLQSRHYSGKPVVHRFTQTAAETHKKTGLQVSPEMKAQCVLLYHHPNQNSLHCLFCCFLLASAIVNFPELLIGALKHFTHAASQQGQSDAIMGWVHLVNVKPKRNPWQDICRGRTFSLCFIFLCTVCQHGHSLSSTSTST